MGDPLGYLRHTRDCANEIHSISNSVAGCDCCFDCNSRDTPEHTDMAWLVPKGRAGSLGYFFSLCSHLSQYLGQSSRERLVGVRKFSESS